MINKHAEEMKVEGLLGVSRIVDRLLNKEEPVSMEANKSNNNQSMVMGNRGQNDKEEEVKENLGMNMFGSIRNQSMKNNNNSMRNNNEVNNDIDTSMGNNNEVNNDNVDELIENDESMEDADMSMGTGQAMNNNGESMENNDSNNGNEGNDNDNEGNNANENEDEAQPYITIGMGKSNSDEDKSNESMAGGAYFKRFFRSKKNKKSVYL